MEQLEQELGLVAEMALGAHSLRSFEAQWLEHFRPAIGFETACSVWSANDGTVLSATSVGYDEATLQKRFPLYMGELSQQEVAAFSASAPAIDTDIVSQRRRQRLTVYRELLAPIHISSFVTNVWRSRSGVFGFHFARARHSQQFSARDTAWIARIAPAIKLGQALLAAEERLQRSSSEPDWWARAWCLSPRELEIARLVARGFQNPEIAELLRISRNTVRNQIVAIFRKAEVSSRTELVFSMAESPANYGQPRDAGRGGAWRAFMASRT